MKRSCRDLTRSKDPFFCCACFLSAHLSAVAITLIAIFTCNPITGASAQTTATSNPYVVNLKEEGARGDGTTNDVEVLLRAIRKAIAEKKPLYIPAGSYLVDTPQLKLLLDDVKTSGLTIYGDGVNLSRILASTVTSSPQVLFTCQARPCSVYYLSIKGVGIFTSSPDTAGTDPSRSVGVQFGDNDYGDMFVKPDLNILVLNTSASQVARAVQMNFVVGGRVRLVANTANATVSNQRVSLALRQTQYTHFTGSVGGVKGISIKLTDGFNVGNVFTAMDMENVDTCVESDSPRNQANTFQGGVFQYAVSGLISRAGSRLLVINPGVNPSPPATVGNFIGKDAAGKLLNTGVTITPAL